MALQTKTLHGARGILYIDGKPIGIFENVSTGVNYSHQEPNVIGRFSAPEVVITGMDPIGVRLDGYRIFNQGPYAIGMTKLQDLLAAEREITVAVEDRGDQTAAEPNVILVLGCKIVSHNFSIAAKQLSRLSMDVVGLCFSDESGVQSEPKGSVKYTSPGLE